MIRKLLALLTLSLSTVSFSASEDPYKNLKFYYGDNHFHSGFSGDNVNDDHPIAAFKNALNQIHQFGTNAQAGGDPTNDLGGYFLFISDHVKFNPVRADMTEEMYQKMRSETNDPTLELRNVKYSFTVFPGGELTGLARNLLSVPPWDSKFGHLNIFNLPTIADFITNGFIYLTGTRAMDKLTQYDKVAIGQINHPGYNDEPRTGDDKNSLYPYTAARDKVFKFFEISDGQSKNWDIGIAQYNICLQKGYHVSPVIGSDIHDTKHALLFQPLNNFKAARTVIIALPTVNLSPGTRRVVLLNSVRKGMVYATENSNLHIKASINQFLIGHQFDKVPNHLTIQIDIEDIRNNPLQTITLVQNKKCEVVDDDVSSESQCTKIIKTWSVKSNTESLFQKGNTQFHTIYEIDSKELSSLKYIYLKVTQSNGDRAMTTPFFFQS